VSIEEQLRPEKKQWWFVYAKLPMERGGCMKIWSFSTAQTAADAVDDAIKHSLERAMAEQEGRIKVWNLGSNYWLARLKRGLLLLRYH